MKIPCLVILTNKNFSYLLLYTSHRPNQEHKDNERTLMNETKWNALLYKNISLILFSTGAHSLRDRWRDIYSERGLLVPCLLPGARGYQRLHLLASRIVRDDLTLQIGCVSLVRLSILIGQSKSDRMILISRGLLPVTHLLDLPTPTHCHPLVY